MSATGEGAADSPEGAIRSFGDVAERFTYLTISNERVRAESTRGPIGSFEISLKGDGWVISSYEGCVFADQKT